MILFQNHLIQINYNPGEDILSVQWPNAEPYNLVQINYALEILVEHIRNYDVKRLLIDTTGTHPSPITATPEYKEIIYKFVSGLSATRLQKAARVITTDLEREAKSRKLSEEIAAEVKLQIQHQDFSTRTEARAWLLT